MALDLKKEQLFKVPDLSQKAQPAPPMKVERLALKHVGAHGDLDIELGTQLVIELGGMEGKLKSTLVGMEPGECLIVRAPIVTGILSKLYEGNRVIVRFMRDGSIYGFASVLMGHVMKPRKLLFIAYPKVIEIHNLRRSRRVECFFRAELQVGKACVQAVILDVSNGGFRLAVEVDNQLDIGNLHEGEALQLSCFPLSIASFPGIAKSISRDNERVIIGVAFTSLRPEQVKSIERYIEDIMKYTSNGC